MNRFLLLRLEGPLQAWGDVAHDVHRPTRAFPSRSALTGLLASALGWTYADGARTNALQDALHFAVMAERDGTVITDYQTAELARVTEGWTHWGIEKRDIQNVLRTDRVYGRAPRLTSTQQLWKRYLADASFLVVLGLHDGAPVTLDSIAAALRRPARPLFLGRRACLPACPLLEGETEALRPYDALLAHAPVRGARCWYESADGPPCLEGMFDLWDRRDFVSGRFEGARTLVEGRVAAAQEAP